MKLNEEIDSDLQDKEVTRWWNIERNLDRWDNFHYSEKNREMHHVLKRQDMTLAYLDSMNLDKNAKILELGFGGGQMAKRILDRGYEYYGIDISSGLAEVATKRCIEHVKKGRAHFIASSIEKKFEFDGEYFDAVLVCGALQYLAIPKNCFEEVYRVLKNKSNFVVCQCNMYSLREIFRIRHLVLKIQNLIMKEEFLYSPCYKSLLTETKLKKYFERYEKSNWMNTKFMTKGYDHHTFDIKKRLYSYWRLKSLLKDSGFETKMACGATFLFPKNNAFNKISLFFNNLLQFAADKKLVPFLFAYADNVILYTKKT
jgi:ubiquinone/menaquinone biosynthesis C-methylase UbiE